MITLRHLHAENFKALRAVDLTFPERGSILIEGPNEAGKSTLFEAVYVGLYGDPLVGEEHRPRLEEVIQHGQPQALVELTFTVGVDVLTVERILRREQTQRVRLTIRRPDGTEEVVNRPNAVNARILQELNNLGGDNLRNSCFVEQKELGRLEEMDSSKREQAIQKLLGLEQLTKLSDQFRFKREQERELEHARRLLDLAHAQADARSAAANERTLAERLDAALIAAHLEAHVALGTERARLQERLAACKHREADVRARLARAERIRQHLAASDGVQRQLEKAATQRKVAAGLEEQLADLDVIERETLPATRARRDKVLAVVGMLVDAERKREAARDAGAMARDAERAVEALEGAEGALRQRAESLDAARARAEQHRQDSQAARGRDQRRLADLAARRQRLSSALGALTAWEQARERQEAIAQEVRGAEEQVRTLADLRATLRQREEAARHALEAAARAEREREEAETHRRQAEGRAALGEWIRLKEVEASLAGFAQDRARLESERDRAADARAAAQGRARPPLFGAVAASLLAVLALAAGTMATWALAAAAAVAAVAILLWVRLSRARAGVRASAAAFAAAEDRLRDLTVAYQAAVRAGGDPALLGQRERELAAAGFAVPPSLDDARTVFAGLPAGGADDYRRAREAAEGAITAAARLAADAERARGEVEQARTAIRALEAAGGAEGLLQSLHGRAVAQREAVDAAEATAREAVGADLPWPATGGQAQAALAACAAEQETIERAVAEAEASAARTERDDARASAQAEQARKTAEDAAAALRAPDPRNTLANARAGLVQVEDVAREAEARARMAAQELEGVSNRATAEAERGRVEERLSALEGQLASRPTLLTDLADARAALAGTLQAGRQALADVTEAVRRLAATATHPEVVVDARQPEERHLAAVVRQVRAALESTLGDLDESSAKEELESILHEQGTLAQNQQAAGERLIAAEEAIRQILTARQAPAPAHYTAAEIAGVWPLAGTVAAADRDRLRAEVERARKELFAAQDRVGRLTDQLGYDGASLGIEECGRRVRELEEERAICQRASRLIQEARERIARQVLPTTERNMQLLLPELTARRYWEVRLTPPETGDGQLAQLDYRIRVWDPTARRYVAKNLFSGGTRDQCSLALRLAFALATLPQELGIAPGFIFLDEPLSAFDAQRAQALVDLLTTGTIAQQFAQVVVISHHHAFDRRAFQYHVRMEGGQAVESDLPETLEQASQRVRRRASATVLPGS